MSVVNSILELVVLCDMLEMVDMDTGEMMELASGMENEMVMDVVTLMVCCDVILMD